MSEITAPNVTQVPNIILDKWMGILTPAEFKVLIFICRKTFGWHKKSDKISLSQIMEATSLSDRGALNCVEKLEKSYKILKVKRKKKPGRNDINTYSLIISERVNSVPEENDGRVNSVPKKGELSSRTKETLTKEIYSRKSKTSDNTQGSEDKEEISQDKKRSIEEIKKSEAFQDSIKLAEFLKTYILEWKHKLSKGTDITKWALDIEKLISLDGYTREEINDVMHWVNHQEANENGFSWREQILSGRSLRKHFDDLHGRYLTSIEKKERL